MRYLYDYGLPFTKEVETNLKQANDRVQNKGKASLWIIDGGVGEGKTTILTHALDLVNKFNGYGDISLKLNDHPQLALGGAKFVKQLGECHKLKLPCIGYDEAGDFSRRGSITRFNAMLNRTFETYRGFKILVIIALPNFNILDNQLFDNNIPRGLLHLFGRTNHQGNFKAYSLVNMNWIRYWADKLPKGIKYKCYDKVVPNFNGHFLDLPPARARQLDTLSTKGKLEVLNKASAKLDGLLNYKQLAEKVGRSVEWTRRAVSSLNIKHVHLYNHSKYFSGATINRLMDHLDTKNGKK